MDRRISSIDALANRTSMAYDAASQQVRITDALGNLTTSLFDVNGRVLARINALGFRTTQVYDAIGHTLALIDAKDHRISFAFDAVGRQTRVMDVLGNRTTTQYDAGGRQTVRIDGRSLRTSFLYNAANWLTGQKYQDGTRVTLSYDAAGQRVVLSDSTGRYTSTFDAASRLSRAINPAGFRLTYAYDADGQRSRLTQPSGRFTYLFDKAGRINRITNPEGEITSWSYDAVGRVTVNRLANGVRVSNSYDKADHLLRLANIASGGTTLSSFSYLYNAVGNRTRVIESNSDSVTWTYDKTYQLTAERRSGANAYAITYAYDGVGNRTRMLSSGVPTTYLYDAANQLTRSQAAAGLTSNTFDGAGNLLKSLAPSNQRTTNTWDGENRLTRVVLPSSIRNTLVYNGDGARVQKQDSSGTTKHVWDGLNILLETDGSNLVQVVYTLEPAIYGNLVSQLRAGVNSFYLFDVLGSTRNLAGNTGVITATYLYDAWGNVLQSTSSASSFQYKGQQGYYFDPDLATCYVRSRILDTASGRFISRDPLGLRGGGINLYGYVLNRPVISTDPSGLLMIQKKKIDPKQTYYPETDNCKKGCEYVRKLRAEKDSEWNKDPGNPGIVICVKGVACACVVSADDHPDPGKCKAYDKCVLIHEEQHFTEYTECQQSGLFAPYRARVPEGLSQKDWNLKFECKKWKESIKCLNDIIKANDCKGSLDLLNKVVGKLEGYLKDCPDEKNPCG